MQLPAKPIANLQSDARDFLDLYVSLGERAENFLPKPVIDSLRVLRNCAVTNPMIPCGSGRKSKRAFLS